MESALEARRRILERIERQYGVAFGNDRLDRLYEAKLLDRKIPIDGDEGRGYSETTWRLVVIAWLSQYLQRDRLDMTELAFWLAYWGFTVPPALVLEHLDDAANAFVSASLRYLDSRGSGYLAQSRFVEKLLRPVLRGVAKLVDWGQMTNRTFGKPVELITLIALKAMLSTKPLATLKPAVLEVAGMLRDEPLPPNSEAAVILWDAVEGFLPFIRLDEQNRMITSVRAFDSSDGVTLLKTAVAVRRFRETAGAVLPWLVHATPETALGGVIRIGEDDCAFVNRYMAPCMCAALLALDNDPEARGRTSALASGDSLDLVDDLSAINAASSLLREKLLPPKIQKNGDPDNQLP